MKYIRLIITADEQGSTGEEEWVNLIIIISSVQSSDF